jgi:AcrR family transcriptional regulator
VPEPEPLAQPSDSAPTARYGVDQAQDRETFFLAAYDILGTSGHSGLSIAALCTRLGVTKGSFYHHFPDMAGFVAAFAARWQNWVIGVMNAYWAEPDLRRRLELMANSHVVTVNGSEPAIRAWSRTSPAMAEAVRAVDNHGLRFSFASFGALRARPEEAIVPTVLAITFIVGLQQRIGQVDPARYIKMGAELYYRLFDVEVDLAWAEYGLAIKVRPCTTASDTAEADFDLLQELRFTRRNPTRPKAVAPVVRRPLEPTAFFAAARTLLAREGSDGMTTGSLCEVLSVSKGSFNHHFAGIDDFVRRMAEDWAHDREGWLDLCEQVGDPFARLGQLIQPMLRQPDPAEASWHAWAWTNTTVGQAVGRFEHRWQTMLTETLVGCGAEANTASLLGEMTVCIAVGLQQRQPALHPSWAVRAVLEWIRTGLRLDVEQHPVLDPGNASGQPDQARAAARMRSEETPARALR